MFFVGCFAIGYIEMNGDGPISGGNKSIDQRIYYLWFMTLIWPTNILIEQIVGRYLISMFYYPYQNSISRESIDRLNNFKFG